jgi:26S proteasome regulatory subunit N10
LPLKAVSPQGTLNRCCLCSLQVSLEEERARQAAAAAEGGAPAAEGAAAAGGEAAPPAAAGAGVADMDMDEDAVLQRALAMSMAVSA